jgi:uncharacterized membrane protein
MSRVRSYGASAVVLLALDALWLGVLAAPFYERTIGPLLRPRPNLLAAALAALSGWSVLVTAVDIAWGALLTAVAAGTAHAAARRAPP